MRTKLQILSMLILSLGITLSSQAQSLPEAGTIGLRASFTGQSSIEVPYMLNETLSLAPSIGFNSTEDAFTSFQIGVRPRFYSGTIGSVVPYFTGNLAVNINNNKVADNTSTDIIIGAGYGGEFFISDRFSISADGNVNLLSGDSPTTISTSARISAAVYF